MQVLQWLFRHFSTYVPHIVQHISTQYSCCKKVAAPIQWLLDTVGYSDTQLFRHCLQFRHCWLFRYYQLFRCILFATLDIQAHAIQIQLVSSIMHFAVQTHCAHNAHLPFTLSVKTLFFFAVFNFQQISSFCTCQSSKQKSFSTNLFPNLLYSITRRIDPRFSSK